MPIFDEIETTLRVDADEAIDDFEAVRDRAIEAREAIEALDATLAEYRDGGVSIQVSSSVTRGGDE